MSSTPYSELDHAIVSGISPQDDGVSGSGDRENGGSTGTFN